MLLKTENSTRDMPMQNNMPTSIPRLPFSMLPIMPKNAIKPAVHRVAFSILIATAEVKRAMMAQMREIILSPTFMELLSVTAIVLFVLG